MKATSRRQTLIALFTSIPIGLLGGLIGLGGAEFRLPVLVGPLERNAREAVPINLAVSLITIVSSLFVRLRVVVGYPFLDLLPILASMMIGAVSSAFIAAGVASRISSHILERWMKFLLISIGCLLIFEGFVPLLSANLIDGALLLQFVVGIVAGILIGIVSSTLGVAGGELLIPTLIFVFGIGVKLAGTASLIISLPTICAGLIRYYRSRAFFDRAVARQIVLPMGAGSVLGSILGGLLFGFVSPSALKVILGVVLIYSAYRMFQHQRSREYPKNN